MGPSLSPTGRTRFPHSEASSSRADLLFDELTNQLQQILRLDGLAQISLRRRYLAAAGDEMFEVVGHTCDDDDGSCELKSQSRISQKSVSFAPIAVPVTNH